MALSCRHCDDTQQLGVYSFFLDTEWMMCEHLVCVPRLTVYLFQLDRLKHISADNFTEFVQLTMHQGIYMRRISLSI